jgi:hypothetical protein
VPPVFRSRKQNRTPKPESDGPFIGNAPKARAEPGTRKVKPFFDDYPRFFETSVTTPYRDRLNSRYDAIFEQHRDVFAGKRVLDIASHDGRWSLAALKTGASHVIGVEGKQHLVDNANENFRHYGIREDSYEFRGGDIHDVLVEEDLDVDVVLCLGFLYHTLRYNELFAGIRKANPQHLIIDTVILPKRKDPLIYIRRDDANKEADAVADRFSHGEKVLIGIPSVPGLKMMLKAYDFQYEHRSDWGAILRDNPGLKGVSDYATGRRITIRSRSKI